MRTTPPIAKSRAPRRIKLVPCLTWEYAAFVLICSMNALLSESAVVADITVTSGNGVHPPRGPLRVRSYAYIPCPYVEVVKVPPRRAYSGGVCRKLQDARTETLFREFGTAGTETINVASTVIRP